MYLVCLIIILIVIVMFIFKYISIINKLNRAVVKVDEAISGIDVALAKRYDVLTKMIEVVKGYSKHEKEVLFEVVKLRNDISMEEKSKLNHIMDENFKKVDLFVENYPSLKSVESYKILQQSIVDVEEHLQAARRVYNHDVLLYNELLVVFPINIIAKRKGMIKKEFFEFDEKKD